MLHNAKQFIGSWISFIGGKGLDLFLALLLFRSICKKINRRGGQIDAFSDQCNKFWIRNIRFWLQSIFPSIRMVGQLERCVSFYLYIWSHCYCCCYVMFILFRFRLWIYCDYYLLKHVFRIILQFIYIIRTGSNEIWKQSPRTTCHWRPNELNLNEWIYGQNNNNHNAAIKPFIGRSKIDLNLLMCNFNDTSIVLMANASQQ